jgi:hypothetical protein
VRIYHYLLQQTDTRYWCFLDGYDEDSHGICSPNHKAAGRRVISHAYGPDRRRGHDDPGSTADDDRKSLRRGVRNFQYLSRLTENTGGIQLTADHLADGECCAHNSSAPTWHMWRDRKKAARQPALVVPAEPSV